MPCYLTRTSKVALRAWTAKALLCLPFMLGVISHMFKITVSTNGKGKIVIDDFCESFSADMSFWTTGDYEKHWEEAMEALCRGEAVSFITSITDPKATNVIRSWACYPIEGELAFQEHLLFLDEIEGDFNLEQPHRNVQAYEAITEDGDEISEWRTAYI